MMSIFAPNWLLPKLETDERVLWVGQPDQGIILTAAVLKLNLIGALILLLSFTWNTMVMAWAGLFDGTLHEPKRTLFWALYLGAIAIGLYLIAGIYISDSWSRSRTYYAVTDQAVYRKEARAETRWALNATTELTLSGAVRQNIWIIENGKRQVVFRDLSDGRSIYDLMRGVKEEQT